MSETEPTHPSGARQATVSWLSRLEVAARIGTVTVVGAYVAGFIVVTLHHAQLGILQFDILRPRVIVAGAVFLLLVLLPIYIALWFFNTSLLSRPNKALSDDPEHLWLLYVLAGCQHCASCVFLTLMVPFLDLLSAPKMKGGIGALLFPLSLIFYALIVDLAIPKGFGRAPRLLTGIACVVTLGMFAAAWAYRPPSFILGAWMSLVGLGAVLLSPSLARPTELKSRRWDVILVTTLSAMFFFYATSIYGGISAAYGGGAPVPVVVHLASEHPFASTELLDAKMVDETDKGFYLLLTQEKNGNAVFIPREQVVAISFQVTPRPAAARDQTRTAPIADQSAPTLPRKD